MELQVRQQTSLESVDHSSTMYITESSQTIAITQDIKERLQALLAKGGPDPKDYKMLDRAMAGLYTALHDGRVSPTEIDELKALFDENFLKATIHGHGYCKPMGYAGDFLLIDK